MTVFHTEFKAPIDMVTTGSNKKKQKLALTSVKCLFACLSEGVKEGIRSS